MAIFKNISTKSTAQVNPLFNPKPLIYYDTSTYDNRENLLVGSPFFDKWSSSGGAIAVPQYEIAPNARQEATLLTHSQTKQLYYSAAPLTSVVAGDYYTFSCYYKSTGASATYHQLNCGGTGGTVAAVDINWTAGTVTTRFGTPVASGITNIGNGWYRVWIVGVIGTGGTGVTPYIVSANAADDTVLIWGAQVEKGQYVSEYANTNNVLFQSEDLSDVFSYGRGGCTISVDQISSPINTLTADAIIEDTALNAYHYVNQVAIKTSSREHYTFSFYVKNKSSDREVEVIVQDGSNGVVARFNPATGVKTAGPVAYGTGYTAVAAGSEFVTNGWYRVWVTAYTNTSTNVQGQIALNTGSSNSYTGNGTSGVYAWGLQLEANRYMSDYVANSGLTIKYRVRTATVKDIGSSNNLATLSGSTPYIDSTGVFTFNGTNQYAYAASNIPSINTINFTLAGWFKTTVASGKKIVGFQSVQIGETSSSYDKHVYVDTSGKLVWGVYDGAVQTVTSSITVTDGAWHHFAAAYDYTNTKIELFLDGISQGYINKRSTDSTTYLRIGSYWTSGWPGGVNGYFQGSIANIGLYPGAFTVEQARSQFYAYRGIKESIVKDSLLLDIDANKVSTVGQVVSRNMLQYPENLNTGLWGTYCGNNSNVTYNTVEITAPDGTYTATKVVRDNVTACGYGTGWGFLWQGVGVLSVGQTYTVSVYARAANGSPMMYLGLNDYHTLAVGPLTSSWQRFSVTRTIGSINAIEQDRGIQFYVTDQNCAFYVWGAQLEPGSTMTTYYPQSVEYSLTPMTTAQDSAGNGNTATLLRSTYYAPNPSRFEIDASNVTTANGLSVSSITFNDATAYSMSFWVKSKATPGATYHSLVGANSTNPWMGIEHLDTTGANWRVYFRASGGTYNYFTAITDYNISSNWIHVTVTVGTDRVVRLYTNGNFRQTILTTPTTTLMTVLRIGAGYNSGGNYYAFQGAIGSTQMYTKQLTGAEIRRNFNEQRWRYGI